MRLILTLALLLTTTQQVIAMVNFDNGVFRLSLDGDWMKNNTKNENQFVFVSNDRNSQITISYDLYQIPDEKIENVANELLQIRFESEHKADSEREVFIGEPWVSQAKGGVQINYIGRDSLNRYFFYTGFVLSDRVVNVYGEIEHSSKEEIEKFYGQVLSNFGY